MACFTSLDFISYLLPVVLVVLAFLVYTDTDACTLARANCGPKEQGITKYNIGSQSDSKLL
jgi:hypothetical protein